MPTFLQRRFPSANTIYLEGPSPILVDPGDDPADLLPWLSDRPRAALLATTHWHSDHAGAVHALQAGGVAVAGSAAEAGRVNAWAPDAGRRTWLRQRLERYRIDRPLLPGDVLDTGAARWTVLTLPGHTAEQIGFHDPAARIAVVGDALHATDLGWLDLDADPRALDHAAATLDQLDALRLRLAFSGHGPAIDDVPAALAGARRRLAAWRREPERIAWHACKRIFTHALMTADGLQQDAVLPLLLDAPWLGDHARRAFGTSPEAFAPALLAEMLRSGAAVWSERRMLATGDYRR